MSYFKTILQKRGLKECPLPLWKLKITEDEFKTLRNLLEKQTHIINMDNPFITLCKESALFFAEYWRRMYVGGKHCKQMVYAALESTRFNVNFSDKFYEAACRGAKELRIESYDGGRADPLNDILYQGGLPMKLVTANITNSVWDRFTHGLVNKKINFEELNLGLVASQSKCMKDYCEQLIIGIEAERHLLMPFYCQNENDVWFLYLKELAKEERFRKHQQNPFNLFFEFKIDHVEKNITIKYVFKGEQRLSQTFLERQGLLGVNFFSLQVRKNGQAVDTFDYVNNFCRYSVSSKHSYRMGDNVSIFLHNQEEPYLSDGLDMDVPHLIYADKDGKYIPGNHIGRDESLLLIPEGWNVQNEEAYTISYYTWGKRKLRVIKIDVDFYDDIKVVGNDGEITFGMNSALYWTDVQSHPLFLPYIIEPVYNVEKCTFTLCQDTEDGEETKRRNVNVQFRNKWQNEWSDKPSYGEIFVRAIDFNGHYVTPMRIINIGDGISVSLIQADNNSCQIKVSWSHGHVSTNEGERKINDVWSIKKQDCHDPRRITFLFTPSDNSKNQFHLSVKAPFKDFSIVNIYGDDIVDECWIPYSDVDKYQYHLIGQDVSEYTYGNVIRQLKWKGEKLYIFENGISVKAIPYEGSLVTLFDSRETLRSLLERTSQNMLNAEVKVQFTLADGNKISFSIKDSPFRPRQIEGGRVVITGNNRKPVKFTGVLKLLKLADPQVKAIEMEYDAETGYYHLPEEIRPWGKAILIGRTRGRICPSLVDLNRNMDGEFRVRKREDAIAKISENLRHSKMGDELWQNIIGWFNRAQKDDIPASSILELYCTGNNYQTLLCLAFQLYVKCGSDDARYLLKEKLKSFSNDLAFQWYWLQPYFSDIMWQLYNFIDDPMSPAIKEVYINWAMSYEGDKRMKYLMTINVAEEYMANIGQCFNDVLTSFTTWMQDFCVSSLLESYDNRIDPIIQSTADMIIKHPNDLYAMDFSNEAYIEYNQDYLGVDIDSFFNAYNEPGTIGNEQWLFKRAKAVVAHLNKEIDLFAIKKEEIRRSIIYCSKSCSYHFIIALNNKLRTSRL